MTILAAQSIASRVITPLQHRMSPRYQVEIEPFVPEAKQFKGLSYGLTAAGYDIRLGKLLHPDKDDTVVEQLYLKPGQFLLAASLERVKIPDDLQVIVHDKSTWARRGLALQNTVLESGWGGYITLELSNHGGENLLLQTGMPIAQLVFHQLDTPTDRPYKGKYQNQSALPTEAIMHHDNVTDLMEDLNDGEQE